MKDSTDIQFLDYLTAIITADGRNPAPARIDKALQRMAVFPISNAVVVFSIKYLQDSFSRRQSFF